MSVRGLLVMLVAGLAVAQVTAEAAHERDATVDQALGDLATGGRLLGPAAGMTKGEAGRATGGRLHPTLDTGAANAARATGAPSGSAGAVAPAVGGGLGGGPTAGGGSSTGSLPSMEPVGDAGGGALGGGGAVGGGGIGGGGSVVNEPPVSGGGDLGGGTLGGGGGVSEPPVTDTSGTNDPWLDVSGDVGVGDTTVDAGVTIQDNPLQDVTLDPSTGTAIDEIIDTTLESTNTPTSISGGAELSGGTETATGVDVSGSTIGGEADAGLEAEVDAAADAGDAVTDPADGLGAALP